MLNWQVESAFLILQSITQSIGILSGITAQRLITTSLDKITNGSLSSAMKGDTFVFAFQSQIHIQSLSESRAVIDLKISYLFGVLIEQMQGRYLRRLYSKVIPISIKLICG